MKVSTHSRPKAAEAKAGNKHVLLIVSTHSRPKAAEYADAAGAQADDCFNTQPPEGG